jgi:hypothetical protein
MVLALEEGISPETKLLPRTPTTHLSCYWSVSPRGHVEDLQCCEIVGELCGLRQTVSSPFPHL